jgi:dienelactone hydrolase
MRRAVLALVTVLVLAGLAAAVVARPSRSPSPSTIRQDDIVVRSGEAELAASIAYPDDGRKHAAVVSVHGSGRLTRQQMRYDPNRLVPAGVVVLTYDKRGVGESTGTYVNVGTATSEAHMPLLADDALACLRALARHPAVDPARVGFIGSSQAGWIIPLALAKSTAGEAAFAIIRSGPATSVGLEMEYSRLTGEGLREVTPISAEEMDRRLAAYAGPHGLDTAPLLPSLRTPALWLLGDADESIPVRQTLHNLRRAVDAGAPFTVTTYPGANHGLVGPAGPVPYWDDVFRWMRGHGFLAAGPSER